MALSEVSIPVPTKQFLELADFLKRQGSDRDPVEAVHDAIQYWMENASWMQDDLLPEVPKSAPPDISDGYWWKSLFLPAGTKVRMIYKGRTYLAEVSSSGIQYEGRSYSPSGFTHHITDTARNAWRDIELLFPGKSSWILAYRLRKG